MGKLVVLKLCSNAEGFYALLEVSDEGMRPHTTAIGQLPLLQTLIQHYQNWQSAYDKLGQTHRAIRPGSITLEGTLTTRRKTCLELAEKLQSEFNLWLQATSFLSIRETLLRELQASNPIQIIIQSDETAIAKLPWHQWDLLKKHDSVEIGFSSLDYEYLAPSCFATRNTPLKILAILGHASDIDIKPDRAMLSQLPGAEVHFLVEVTRQGLSEALWSQRWDILFFAGHSDTEADRGYIYLNPTDRLTLGELKATLGQAVKQGLQLAIFNSCDGLGLAQELKSLGIPQTIVMREPVPDFVAQAFLKYFLQAFAQGEPLQTAVRLAREKLEGLEDRFPCASWLPVMVQNPAAPLFSWSASSPSQHLEQANVSAAPLLSGKQSLLGWGRFALTSILITASVTALRLLGGLQPIELWAFDQWMRLRPDEPPDSRLLLVEVTEENLRQYGGATLSDQMLAEGLKILETNGARAIGVDIYRDIPQEPGRTKLLQQLQQSNRTFMICQHAEAGVDPGTPPPKGILPEQVGFSDAVADADDVVRRHLFSMNPPDRTSCETHYALSLVLAEKYLETEGISESGTLPDALQFGEVTLRGMAAPAGGYQRADLGGYQTLLNYRRSNGSVNQFAQSVTFDALIKNQVSPSAIADRIVLVGITAQSRKDEFRTPYGEKIKGVALQAQMTSQIVSATLDGRLLLWAGHWGADLIWILSWSGIGALVAGFCSTQQRLWLTEIGVVLLLSGICFIVFWKLGLWLPWIPSIVALVLTSVVCQRFFYKPLSPL
ncbi:CHASE2 domain-containing protein [Cyanobacteria bacterium FACHB-502]|nr:CHASE2 domain-containing protein [Cyanobacteria bacterium FACHB-502]